METVESQKGDEKFCCKCSRFIPLTGFHADKKTLDGLKYCCKECVHEYSKKRYRERKILSERDGFCIRYNCRFKTLKAGGLCAMHFYQSAATNLKSVGAGLGKNFSDRPQLWKDLEGLAEKQDYICALTGDKLEAGVNMSLDHIKPVSKYPELIGDINNMQWLTKWANTSKSDISTDEFVSNCLKVVSQFN